MPKNSGRRALADIVLRGGGGRPSATLEGTVRCVQNRLRLVRALYERLDRLEPRSSRTYELPRTRVRPRASGTRRSA
ncbi:hypothetical protein ACF1BU_37185 [Streptomyces sp. NPDC014724]|uniref:hypothetical protein n=1 Tax=unclassified Streptomyces TaxID=2593676 RepID=UPI0036FFB2E5